MMSHSPKNLGAEALPNWVWSGCVHVRNMACASQRPSNLSPHHPTRDSFGLNLGLLIVIRPEATLPWWFSFTNCQGQAAGRRLPYKVLSNCVTIERHRFTHLEIRNSMWMILSEGYLVLIIFSSQTLQRRGL